VADEIERWSEELARDPGSGVFIPLADALRRRGQLDLAYRVATRGLARRPYDGDAHDLLARIWADRGDVERALDEWSIALQCAPAHAGALKGMGFACYQAGRLADAERYLVEAAAVDPDDISIRTALVRVRQLAPQGQPAGAEAEVRLNGADHPSAIGPTEVAPLAPADGATKVVDRRAPGRRVDPRLVFAEHLDPADQAALLVDADGLVLAGSYVVADGRDVAQEVGAALSGVSDEARRAMRHLGLGAWSSLVFEAEAATVGMAPVGAGPAEVSGDASDGVAFVAAGPSVPLGLVRRLLARVGACGREWLERDGAGADR
jgi:tetratricopeptide (TPR) repeat protein